MYRRHCIDQRQLAQWPLWTGMNINNTQVGITLAKLLCKGHQLMLGSNVNVAVLWIDINLRHFEGLDDIGVGT